MDSAQPSDEELLAKYKSATGPAKRQAADALFARHYDRVSRWCYRLTGSRDSGLDLAQDVFLIAHRHLDQFHGQARFSTWLYSIARNESFSRHRRLGRQPDLDDNDEALAEAPTLAPGPEELASEGSRRDRLMQFLGTTLDEDERTVFTMHYGEGASLDAITRLLRLQNTSGAKAYIVSAKRKIARAVERLRARGETW